MIEENKAIGVFPDKKQAGRLADYDYYESLFLGKHFEAFNIRVDDERYTKAYSKLRYVCSNFAGLISKLVADMLFSEPITVSVPEGDQAFVDAFWRANKLDVQCYESALSNSYLGDALFKLRIGKLYPYDDSSTVIAEDITPKIYFPNYDTGNVRAVPESQELCWIVEVNAIKYLRKEIHSSGMIENKLFLLEGENTMKEVDIRLFDDTLTPVEVVDIKQSLITHIPNWRAGNRYFGLSDYMDIDSLFYAINNRMSSIDNILDKHSDPILMVPPGVMDEKGNVRKKALGVIEVADNDLQKPEYIIWDASLENAFREIEKLVEMVYLVGEVSPDILGVGKGTSDSGRALKYKLLRTIAKTARKKLYYDGAIKEMIYNAQLLAQAYGLSVNGVKLTKAPVMPEISWADGIPVDAKEQLENETMAIDAGVTSKRAAISRIYQMDEKASESMLTEIKEEGSITLPSMSLISKYVKTAPRMTQEETKPTDLDNVR